MHTLTKITALAALSCALFAGSAALADDGRRSVAAALDAAQPRFGAAQEARNTGRGVGSDVRGDKREPSHGDRGEGRVKRETGARDDYRAGARDHDAHREKRALPARTREPSRGQQRVKLR
jgi:hypothetical protein